MRYEDVEEKGFLIYDISACNLCKNYVYVGRIGGTELCQSKESPYYKAPKEGYEFRGTFLEWWKMLKGCNRFMHNGRKIPSSRFISVPSDSILRTLRLELIVDDFEEVMNLRPYISTQDIIDVASDNWRYVESLIKTGKTADELGATTPILKFLDKLGFVESK